MSRHDSARSVTVRRALYRILFDGEAGQVAQWLIGGGCWVDSRRQVDGTWTHTRVYRDTRDQFADIDNAEGVAQ